MAGLLFFFLLLCAVKSICYMSANPVSYFSKRLNIRVIRRRGISTLSERDSSWRLCNMEPLSRLWRGACVFSVWVEWGGGIVRSIHWSRRRPVMWNFDVFVFVVVLNLKKLLYKLSSWRWFETHGNHVTSPKSHPHNLRTWSRYIWCWLNSKYRYEIWQSPPQECCHACQFSKWSTSSKSIESSRDLWW